VAEFVVEMRAVHKIFHQGLPIETEVLHGVDLQLKTSEFCAVMGPSGSGKSTLLNIIGLLDRPSSGSLSICNKETTAMNDHELTRLRGHSIGFVFQSHYLIPAFTALENVMIPMVGNAEFSNAAMVRYFGHFQGDPESYRPKDEVARLKKTDPIPKLANMLLEKKLITVKEQSEIDQKMRQLVDEAFEFARKSDYPKANEALHDVFVNGYKSVRALV
jgi:ABC-type sugar transport system ATPase subunit